VDFALLYREISCPRTNKVFFVSDALVSTREGSTLWVGRGVLLFTGDTKHVCQDAHTKHAHTKKQVHMDEACRRLVVIGFDHIAPIPATEQQEANARDHHDCNF